MIEFFPLSEKDLEYIDGVRKVFPDGWNMQMLRSAISAGGFYGAVAVENGKKVGFVLYTVGLDFADIESVFVETDFRRRGIGKGLLSLALKNIEGCGIKKVLLEVRRSNLNAVNLYSKLGFNKISERKKYYADGEDALVFSRES